MSWNYYQQDEEVRQLLDNHSETSLSKFVREAKDSRAGRCTTVTCSAGGKYFKKDWCPMCGNALFWETVKHAKTKVRYGS